MLSRVILCAGESRYEIFRLWQERLAVCFRQLGVEAEVKPVGAETPADDTLTVGFNLVRAWTSDNRRQRHFMWMVDHPLYNADFFMPWYSKLPVNPDACAIGSVDRNWRQFALTHYRFPHVYFLPHTSAIEPFVRPDWSARDLDVVVFGSIVSPQDYIDELRRRAGPLAPRLEAILHRFRFDPAVPHDQTLWALFKELGMDDEHTVVAMNAFFPMIDSYHRDLTRVRALKAIRRTPVHLFGYGPWKEMGLPSNITIHEQVTYAEALAIMVRAKVLINHTPTLAGGGHERVFDAIASGCFVVATDSAYLLEEFGGSAGVRYFRDSTLAELDPLLQRALRDPATPEWVAATQQVAFQRHRLFHRVETMLTVARERWPEVFG